LLLALAAALDRLLRTPRAGVTSKRLASKGPLDLLPMAGVAVLAPQARADVATGVEGQGGGFGGGGASGQY
jgi:hypothetical protein